MTECTFCAPRALLPIMAQWTCVPPYVGDHICSHIRAHSCAALLLSATTPPPAAPCSPLPTAPSPRWGVVPWGEVLPWASARPCALALWRCCCAKPCMSTLPLPQLLSGLPWLGSGQREGSWMVETGSCRAERDTT